MSTTTLAAPSPATMQALLASLTPAQIAELAAMAQAQQAQQLDTSGAKDDPEVVAQWLKTCGRGKLRTIRAYAGDISEFFMFLGGAQVSTITVTARIKGQQVTEQITYITTPGKRLAELKVADLLAYRERLAASGLAPSTQGRRLSAVRSMLSYGQESGYLRFNVGTAVKPDSDADGSAVGETRRLLSEEEILRMIHRSDKERDRLLLSLLYKTASRVGEFVALTWEDISVQAEAVVVTI